MNKTAYQIVKELGTARRLKKLVAKELQNIRKTIIDAAKRGRKHIFYTFDVEFPVNAVPQDIEDYLNVLEQEGFVVEPISNAQGVVTHCYFYW